MPPATRDVTIYRFSRAAPDADALFVSLDGTYLDDLPFRLEEPEYEGAVALGFHWERPPETAPWVQAASLLMGAIPHYNTRDSGGLLLLTVDDDTYAIGFGSGWRLVPDALKDRRFGLTFTIRAVDAGYVRSVVRRTMSGLGRQDSTHVPDGIPIGHIGLSEYTELVRRLAGQVHPGDLGLDGTKPLSVEGSAGLRLRIPLDRRRLVALLRRISEICARGVPDDFAFVEAIMPVQGERLTLLDEELNTRLNAAPGDETGMRLASAVPSDLTDRASRTQSYRIKIGSVPLPPRTDLDLDDILRRCRVQHRVPPVEALRRGEVQMFQDADGRQELGKAPADQWLEASTCLDGREYFLIDGVWYEGGTEYFTSVRRRIAALFKPEPSIAFRPWNDAVNRPGAVREKSGETLYNEWLEDELGIPYVLNLDTQGVKTGFHGSKGFEPCDLLGPENELVHVKGGKGTAPFSHLFNQALISTEALWLYPHVRHEFAALVHKVSRGARTLPDDWRPRKIVFGMMADRQKPFTPTTLFPHAQIALAHMSRELESRFEVEVEVIPIPRDSA